MTTAILCAPCPELSCFACCPPIRPPGYDHADHRSSLTRLLADNRAAFLAGQIPTKHMQGFWCAGLGFLDPRGRRVGCLFHPVMNQGRDLRGPTGYQEKCARESCPEFRAFAALAEPERETLMGLCRGMDPFTFSSRSLNPVMRLLALGPEVAGPAAGLAGLSRDELDAWPVLADLEPALAWPLARLIAAGGAEDLRGQRIILRVEQVRRAVRQALTPRSPSDQGDRLAELGMDEWEARFWRGLLGRLRARPEELAAWRAALSAACRAPRQP